MALTMAVFSFGSACSGCDTSELKRVQWRNMPRVLMPVQADSCNARLPNEGSAGWPVMANTGMPLSCAQATPVIRLVAPGPEVAQHTPSLPVSRA